PWPPGRKSYTAACSCWSHWMTRCGTTSGRWTPISADSAKKSKTTRQTPSTSKRSTDSATGSVTPHERQPQAVCRHGGVHRGNGPGLRLCHPNRVAGRPRGDGGGAPEGEDR